MLLSPIVKLPIRKIRSMVPIVNRSNLLFTTSTTTITHKNRIFHINATSSSSSPTATAITTTTQGEKSNKGSTLNSGKAPSVEEIQYLLIKYKNKNFRKNTLLVVLALLLIASMFTTPEQRKHWLHFIAMNGDKLDDTLSQLIIEQCIKDGVVGGTCCIIRDNKIIYHKSYGYSDLENSIPMDLNHKMRIASISKSMTAVTLATLVDEGLIDWDEPVYKYLAEDDPRFANLDKRITARMLAAHLSGIRGYKTEDMNEPEFLSKEQFDTVADSLSMFINDSLKHEPGSQYLYSTFGYSLLALLIESVAKKQDPKATFLSVIQDRLFNKLNLYDTCPDIYSKLIKRRAKLYRRTKDGLENAPYVNLSNKWAGGGFLSTALDVCNFGNALLQKNAVVSEKTIQEMFSEQFIPIKSINTEVTKNPSENTSLEVAPSITESSKQEQDMQALPAESSSPSEENWNVKKENSEENRKKDAQNVEINPENETETVILSAYKPPNFKGTGYGLGFSTKQEYLPNRKKKVKVVAHTGGAVGASSILYMIPEERLVISVIVNTENVKLTPLATLMAKETIMFLDKDKIYG
jgi:CubicO group peptidase (beta-lactamase class C family)